MDANCYNKKESFQRLSQTRTSSLFIISFPKITLRLYLYNKAGGAGSPK